MHCRDIRKKLSAWSDGETNQQLSDQIRKHLTTCLECNRVLQEIQSLQMFFQQSPIPPLPQEFTGAVMKKVRLLAANRSEVFRPLLWWRNLTFSLKASSTIAFGLVLNLGIYMGGNLTRGKPPEAQVSYTTTTDAVVASMVQPFEDAGSETIAHAFLTITMADERRP